MNIMNLFFTVYVKSDIRMGHSMQDWNDRSKSLCEIKDFPFELQVTKKKKDSVEQEFHTLIGKTEHLNIEVNIVSDGSNNTTKVWVTDHLGIKKQVAKETPSPSFFWIIDFPHRKEVVCFIKAARKEIKRTEKVMYKNGKKLIEKGKKYSTAK